MSQSQFGSTVGQSLSPVRCPAPPDQLEQGWKTEKDPDVAPIPHRFRPRLEPGVQLDTSVEQSPLGLFKHFFSADSIRTLSANTNKLAERNIAAGKRYKWTTINPAEMFKFIGLVLYMGVLKLPAVNDYWKRKNIFSVNFPNTVMTRDRFRAISWNIHMSDPEEDVVNDRKKQSQPDEYDTLFRLKPLMTEIKAACQSAYHPKKQLSIDERMVATKARTGMTQYMKAKPTKWGIKLFVLADSSNGYTCDFNIYTGKSRLASGLGLSFDSVVALMRPSFLGSGYHLYCDNFYTSPKLFRHLLSLNFGACGTIREGRKEAPKTKINQLTKKSPRGTLRWIREENLVFTKWMDNREVAMCSSVHVAYDGDTVKRKQKKMDGSWEETNIPVPKPIVDYNMYMGGVDLSDQLIQYYSVHHTTRRWYRTMFFHFIDIAVTNGFIMYREIQKLRNTPANQLITHKAYVEQLVAELCGVTVGAVPVQRRTGHTPVPISKPVGRLRCEKCKTDGLPRKDTSWKCNECDVPLCLQPERNCFHMWHNM